MNLSSKSNTKLKSFEAYSEKKGVWLKLQAYSLKQAKYRNPGLIRFQER